MGCKMRTWVRAMSEGRRGRVLIGLVNWSPAMVFFGLFVAYQDLLFFSYAVVFAMWQQFAALRRL